MTACLRFTRRVWKSFLDQKDGLKYNRAGHDMQCFPNLVVQKAIPGQVHASLKIEPYHVNRVGTVHGGLILSLTDTMGSLAVASKGQYMTGVSTDVQASFVKPAGRPGDTLTAKAVLTGMGKSLAFTRIDFTNSIGELVAYGTHTKYVGRSLSDPNNVTFSDDGETTLGD